MKPLSNLEKKLTPPNSRTNPADIPTIKDVLVDSLMFSRPQSGTESIQLRRIAEKLSDAKEKIDLENAEFDLLKDTVNQNPAQYYTWAHGQVMVKLDDWSRLG